MFKTILQFLGKIFSALLPYTFTFVLFSVLFTGETKISNELNLIQAEVEQNQLDAETMYTSVLDIDQALAGVDIVLSKRLDQIKLDNAKQNDSIVKTIYTVDKNSIARDQGIVDGVNAAVDSMNYALQKPSYDYLKNITVRIIGRAKNYETAPSGEKGWMGTGVIIAITQDYTYILTNRHLMEDYGDGTYDYYVKDEDGVTHHTLTALKISKDENVDLALVRVDGHISGKIAVIGFGQNPKPQDPVYMVGMDLGRPWFYSEGTVAGFDPDSQDELVVGMPVGPGNSGSGVIDKKGGLVGLLYAGSIIDQEGIDEMDISHGLCVPLKAIKLFLAGYIE